MRNFILGCIVGGFLTGATTVMAGKDVYSRSPQQHQYDYFRQRQQQLDIEHMRKQMDKQEFDRKTAGKPC
jgi:hypothetical protein